MAASTRGLQAPQSKFKILIFGISLRVLIYYYFSSTFFENRPELITPLTSKRYLKECVALMKLNLNPYQGDSCHELPMIIYLYDATLKKFPNLSETDTQLIIWIILDILSAYLLSKIGPRWENNYNKNFEKAEKQQEIKNSENRLTFSENFYLQLYFLNPITIASCLSFSTQVFYNSLILIFFYSIPAVANTTVANTPEASRNSSNILKIILGATAFSIICASQLYPVQLLIPLLFQCNGKDLKNIKVLVIFSVIFISSFLYLNYLINNDSLLSIYNFILNCPDYTPNTGIWWYLITEMFEHFRDFFVGILTINVFFYAIPICLRFKNVHELTMNIWILYSIQAIFKSYSTLSDLVVPLTLLPIFNISIKHRKTTFIGFIAIFICVSLSPIMWSQWIILGRGNANFFFATSLGVNVAATLIVTDILQSHVMEEFVFKNNIASGLKLVLGKIE